jgi:hypothetical protein
MLSLNRNSKLQRFTSTLSFAVTLLIAGWLICPGAAHAQTGSYFGLMLQAQNQSAFTVPPGASYTDVNQFDAEISRRTACPITPYSTAPLCTPPPEPVPRTASSVSLQDPSDRRPYILRQ